MTVAAILNMCRSALALSALALAACVPVPELEPAGADAPAPVEDANISAENGNEGMEGPGIEEADEVTEPAKDTAVATTPLTDDADTGRISDEQDFDAVSNRQTIESDAARLKAQREAYLEIRYIDLPVRSDGLPPNIVEFALSTSNAVGEQVWDRIGIFSEKRHQTNCASYAHEDFAQEAFLANGGPQRNWQNLDPDGDGFACGWDPTPFRDSVAANE